MKKELIAQNDPKSPISEVFRSLRTNIQFMNKNKELKTLLVTSTYMGEGKSWVASNLAVTFAQAGKKVIIVDADLRKGRQYTIFNVGRRPGLSNFLSGIDSDAFASTDDIVKFIRSTEVENLFLIPAGDIPPNPSELLVSDKTVELIAKLREISDIVIFDGTPSLVVTDAIILSRFVDSTIIVSKYNSTKMDNLSKIKKAIENVGGKIAGVVINRIPVSAKKYDSSYYYYGSSGNSKNKEEKKASKGSSTEFIEIQPERKKNTQRNSVSQTNQILNDLNKYLEEEKVKLKNKEGMK